jgi:hypothetical protein
MTSKNPKDQLLDLIDHKAFNVILAVSPKTYDGKDKEKLEELPEKTEKEKRRFHGYGSAKQIRENFMEMSVPSQQRNSTMIKRRIYGIM